MHAILAFVVMMAAYLHEGDQPFFAEPRVSLLTLAALQKPDTVSVQAVYPSEEPDIQVGDQRLRKTGGSVAIYPEAWANAWQKIQPMTVHHATLMKLCTFHPDRLVVLRKGDHEVRIVTCHSCRQMKIITGDREESLVSMLPFHIDYTLLDRTLPADWADQAVLEEGLGRETLAVMRSPVAVRAAWVAQEEVGLASTQAVLEALSRGSKSISPAFVEGLLISGTSLGRHVIAFPDAVFPDQRSSAKPWSLALEVRSRDNRKVLLQLIKRGSGSCTLSLVRDEPDESLPALRVSSHDVGRLFDSVGLKHPGQ